MNLPAYRALVKSMSQSCCSIITRTSVKQIPWIGSCFQSISGQRHFRPLVSIYQFQLRQMCYRSEINLELEPKHGLPARRSEACFKCGEEGHFAKDCTQPNSIERRTCYKCGVTGHLSKDCPQDGGLPQRRSEACFNCGEEGHLAKHCTLPALRDPGPKWIDSIACFRCGKAGHKAEHCDKERSCYNCGSKDHLARDCPEEERCSNCGQHGHRRAECFSGKKCFNCGQYGHLARDCDAVVSSYNG